MVGYIYLITDTTNGMKYAGKHHYHIEGQLDPNYHGSGVIIKNIYKKRPETLKEEYIKTCYSEEEMCSDEKYYIKLFKTLWPNGYNLTEGGDGGEIPCEEVRKKMSMKLKGRHISEETRKKMSESKKNISDETRKKMSEARKKLYSSGTKHPMLGKHHSEETINKISNSLKGQHPTDETRKKLSDVRKGRIISEETKQKISNSKKGRRYLTDEQYRKIGEKRKGIYNTKCSKKVLQFTLDDEFVREWPSIQECGRNGFNQRHVCNCCQGKRKSHKGFKWMYADDYIE